MDESGCRIREKEEKVGEQPRETEEADFVNNCEN